MPAFAHARSTSSPSILAPIPLRPLSLVPESASSRKTPSTPDERLTLFEPPTRPVLAVIQPPSGSWSQNGGDGSILAGPSARGRHDEFLRWCCSSDPHAPADSLAGLTTSFASATAPSSTIEADYRPFPAVTTRTRTLIFHSIQKRTVPLDPPQLVFAITPFTCT
ncbi:hypothetical protein NBRC10513v2_003055 [Rhodotorula toruloides]|uniref:Uncharacterized protein n=1 Tax=Rhodotorula toruloides TaxID=5286 RepID=A0A2T0AB16_RHOTO|nr:hypothetical protein AAT19DRAFT_14216 [Rhodotorula toruloides]